MPKLMKLALFIFAIHSIASLETTTTPQTTISDRFLKQKLNQVQTSSSVFIKTTADGVIPQNDLTNLSTNPEFDRNNGRVQIMSNYDLQFTDDISIIIQNVLLYRKNFNQAKTLYNLMNQKSYYWGSNYEQASQDPRSGRPLNLLLANEQVVQVPRKLRDEELDIDPLANAHEHTKKTLVGVMGEEEYLNSGFDEVAKRFNPDRMYGLSNRARDMGDLFEKVTKNRRTLL